MKKSISALVEQMKQPQFYPHAVENVKTDQTHASYIFLTGDYAYKLKKPINFGFLDFSTLEKRKFFCEQELGLNKPVAPELYLEVLPITKEKGKFILNDMGEAVEYVLKMRQFPQDDLLINLFKQGLLTEERLEELGKVIARFHTDSKTDDYINSFGEVDKIRAGIKENYQQTEKYIGVAQTQKQYEETQQFTNAFLEQRELFKSRQNHHKIKECHGDLHLKNICLWHNKIQLFDRIEFNESFRFVDVMYDVAFTVMDLEVRESKNLGNAFLNTYLEQTGDWEGVQVLPLYLSRQAYVRAKVTSFLLDDLDSEPDRQKTTQTAADYYRLAWQYTQRNQGRLILMSGLSGSGKSTVARRLARHIGAIQIRSDAVRKHLSGIPVGDRGGDEMYTPQMSENTYTRLVELGGLLAGQGFPVILDAKFDRQIWRNKAIALAQSKQIPLTILHCTAPLAVLKERLGDRQDISDATPDLLEQQQSTSEPFTQAEQEYVTTIDTAASDWSSQLNRQIEKLFGTRND